MQIAGMILTQALVLQRTNHIELIWQHLRRTAGSGDWHPLAAALEEWLESLGILHENQGRSQAAPLAASRQRTRCRDRPQPQRTSRILRDSYHSGTDAARGCQSPLPASLPLAPPFHQKNFKKIPHQNRTSTAAVRKKANPTASCSETSVCRGSFYIHFSNLFVAFCQPAGYLK